MPAYAVEIEHRETDQVFSYYHGNKMLHFNVSLLARLHQTMKPEFRRVTIDLTDAEYDLCMRFRGIEEPKVEALTASQLREPGYAVLFDDNTFTIVDGHHRLVRRWRGNVRIMDFWVTHADVWQHCLIEYTEEGERMLQEAIPPRQDNPAHIATGITVHKR